MFPQSLAKRLRIVEGWFSRNEFVESQSQSIDIALLVSFAFELLWGHIAKRSHDIARLGKVSRFCKLSQSKVGNPCISFVISNQIGRFLRLGATRREHAHTAERQRLGILFWQSQQRKATEIH